MLCFRYPTGEPSSQGLFPLFDTNLVGGFNHYLGGVKPSEGVGVVSIKKGKETAKVLLV